jgi:hypothetical protein
MIISSCGFRVCVNGIRTTKTVRWSINVAVEKVVGGFGEPLSPAIHRVQ